MKRICGFVIALLPILGSGVVANPQDPKIQDRIGIVTTQSEDVVSPLAAFPLDHFHVTGERPLFAPSRRPPTPAPVVVIPPPAPPPPPPPPAPPNVVLLGVVMDGDLARAIIQAAPGNVVRRVRVGDDIGGWKVSQIEPRRLILSLEGRVATFTLFERWQIRSSPVKKPS